MQNKDKSNQFPTRLSLKNLWNESYVALKLYTWLSWRPRSFVKRLRNREDWVLGTYNGIPKLNHSATHQPFKYLALSIGTLRPKSGRFLYPQHRQTAGFLVETIDAKATQPPRYFKQVSLQFALHFFFLSGSLRGTSFITFVRENSDLSGGRFFEASNLTSDFELQISGDLLCTEIIIKKINSLATRWSGIWVLQ